MAKKRADVHERRVLVAWMCALGRTARQIAKEIGTSVTTVEHDKRYNAKHSDPLVLSATDALLAYMANESFVERRWAMVLKIQQERHKLWGLYKQDPDIEQKLANAASLMQEAIDNLTSVKREDDH